MVSLALFDTLLSLNNEDLVVALVLKYLLPCHHVPLAHKRKINETEPYLQASEYFINLTPEIMKLSQSIANDTGTVPNSWNNYGLNITDSLYCDYYAYTFDAHHKIAQCKKVVDRWTNKYQRYQKRKITNDTHDQEPNSTSNSDNTKKSSQKVQMIKQILEEMDNGLTGTFVSPVSASEASDTRNKLHDSLQSIGESSGYESFRYRPEDDEQSEGSETLATSKIEDLSSSSGLGKITGEPWKVSSQKIDENVVLESADDLFTAGTVNLGAFFQIF